jgi:hypothetical protein
MSVKENSAWLRVGRSLKLNIHMSFYFYQTLYNNFFYPHMFRLPIVTVIKESLFTDARTVQHVNEWPSAH